MSLKQKADLNFGDALKLFVANRDRAKHYARVASELAIEHYAQHGDVCHLETMLNAMSQNYDRKQAFIAWMVAHAPIIMVEKRLMKGSDGPCARMLEQFPDTHGANLEKALEKPFWEYAPEKEVENFSYENLFEAVGRLIKKYENTERQQPQDDAARLGLTKLKNFYASNSTPPAQEVVTA